jgi:hypothetical protein
MRLSVCAGPLEQLETVITTMKYHDTSFKEDLDKFSIILLTYPAILENLGTSNKCDQRIPMTGTIDEIGMNIKRIKGIGIRHIIYGYNF